MLPKTTQKRLIDNFAHVVFAGVVYLFVCWLCMLVSMTLSLAMACSSVNFILLTKHAADTGAKTKPQVQQKKEKKPPLIDGLTGHLPAALHLDHFRCPAASTADMHVYSIFRQMSGGRHLDSNLISTDISYRN